MDIDKTRHRWEDPLLTGLTILMLVMMFVVAPLQALGVFAFQVFELLLAIMLVAGVFVISGSRTAVAAMLVALAMIVTGAVLRIRSPSILDLNLFAGAWLIVGVTLAWAVARSIFAPGRVTYHRVVGAVLLYLTVAIIFAAFFTFLGTLDPKAFIGLTVRGQSEARNAADLFQLHDVDHDRLWRPRSRASDRAQPSAISKRSSASFIPRRWWRGW